MLHGAPPGCGTGDRWISTIIPGSPFPIPLRPDLVNVCTREVYEIKPILSVPLGFAQLAAYITIMNLADRTTGALGLWTPGSSYMPPSAVPVVGALVFAVVGPPVAGVIPYEIVDLSPIFLLAARAATLGQSSEGIQNAANIGSITSMASFGVIF